MVEQQAGRKPNHFAVDRLDSEMATTGSTAEPPVQHFANNEERAQAYKKFAHDQNIELQHRHEEDHKHEEHFEEFHQLELVIDEKITDAIRHAETGIREMEAEIKEVTIILGEKSTLIERIEAQLAGSAH